MPDRPREPRERPVPLRPSGSRHLDDSPEETPHILYTPTDQILTSHSIDDTHAYQHYLDLALRYLSFRPRSEREIVTYLQRKECPSSTMEAVLTRLRGLGYVNDTEFVRFWTDSRRQHNPKGRILLRAELRAKGIDDEHLQTMDQSNDSELGAALAASRKRARILADAPPTEFRRKMWAFLSRRGFSSAVIAEVIARIADGSPDSEDSQD